MIAVEECFRTRIWTPPARVKNRQLDDGDVFLKIISGGNVHVRLFSPDAHSNTCRDNTEKRDANLIIYFHGNAEDLSTCESFLSWLSLNTEYDVLCVDYMGYGRSSGENNTTESNMCVAADAVLDYALNTLKYKYHTIVVMGRSLGSIPAVHLASKTDNAGLQGLVLVSGLASGARCILSSAYVPSVMLTSLDNAFGANIQRISGVQCMVLLVHGDHDTEVSLSNSQVLKERCNGWCHPELIVIRGGSHNNIWNMYARQVLKPLTSFLANSKENARLHSCDEAAKTPYSTGCELFEF